MMINIDDDEFEEETLEERVFEKADYIGEILVGEKKVNLSLAKISRPKQTPKPKKPSKLAIFINDFKTSINKYKSMPLKRLLGLGIILLVMIFCIAIISYLLLTLMTELLKLGIIGFIIFAIFICSICICGILLLASRYTRK